MKVPRFAMGAKAAGRVYGRVCGRACLVALLAVLLFATSASSRELDSGGGQRGAYLWTKTVRGDFEEVLENVRSALGRKNFPLNNIRNYRENFNKRLQQTGGDKLPYAQYQLLEFCNVMLAIEALRKDARMGVFMPCRIVLYSRPGSGEVTLMTVNPRFMPKILDNPELASIAARVEAAILEIFESVDF